jgi:hypothetical protein
LSPVEPYRACLTLALLMAVAAGLRAEEPTDDPAIDAGRKALRDSASYPWYDSETDGLRDLHAKAKADDDTDTRKTGWQWELPPVTPVNVSPPRWQFPTLWSVVQYSAIALLIALIVGLVVLLIRYFLKMEETSASGSELSFDEKPAEIDGVEQLPFVVRRPTGDFLSEARALYEQGRYAEAIIYLYSYQLVQLDRHQHIHLSKGKTNRQYLREIRSEPTLRGMLHRTMIAFEDVFFGHHDLDRSRFEECWQRLDEFHRQLEQGAAA